MLKVAVGCQCVPRQGVRYLTSLKQSKLSWNLERFVRAADVREHVIIIGALGMITGSLLMSIDVQYE